MSIPTLISGILDVEKTIEKANGHFTNKIGRYSFTDMNLDHMVMGRADTCLFARVQIFCEYMRANQLTDKWFIIKTSLISALNS